MNAKQTALINDFISYLSDDEKHIYGEIIDLFSELGYIPQRKRVGDFTLSFKHRTNGKVIGKISFGRQKCSLRIKFFACGDVPEKYTKALYDEAVENENRYSRDVPPPDDEPVPSDAIMKKCTLQCAVCTGGKMRYYLTFPDGRRIFRCGAYPVLIPDVAASDIADIKRLIVEQHNYFLSI